MKRLLLVLAVIVAAVFGWGQFNHNAEISAYEVGTGDQFSDAFKDHGRNLQVTGEGVVSKLLSDDNDGSRHQRFVLVSPSGQTLLVAHNIDVAPRIDALVAGDPVQFHGVYEWNAKGGVIHWTHRDLGGNHEAGWLKHRGRIYQ